MDLHLQKGRWFNATDNTLGRRVCVIDDTVRMEYFRLSAAVGRTIALDHEPYEVIGILENVETSSDSKYTVDDVKALNRRVCIPLERGALAETQPPLARRSFAQ